jgi:hypothetical protein
LLQLKKAQAEAADATTQLVAVEQALKTLEAGDMDAIKHQYVDAVRKMAVTQVRPKDAARKMAVTQVHPCRQCTAWHRRL